jgi:hypothetical protein
MEPIRITKLKVLHDRAGRILAAVHDDAPPAGGPTIGIRPARGQTLVAVEVPVAQQHLTMGQLFSRLQLRSGRMLVNEHPVAAKSRSKRKSSSKRKSRGRKK